MKQFLLVFAFVLGGIVLHAQSPKPDLSVYPNPATEYIFVQDNNDAVSEIQIVNLIGKKVKVFAYNKGEQFYIADLPKGMYLVQILDHNKSILTTQKLEKR
jgi:hypothetical protein